MSAGAMKFSRQIPAQQGWFVLSILSDETGFPVGVDKACIVAWAFEDGDEFSVPYPATMAGVRLDDPAILDPTGAVVSVARDNAPSLHCWITDIQTDYRFKNGGR